MAASLNDIVSEIANRQLVDVKLVSHLLEGHSNNVYELRTGDNKRWCLRVPVDAAAGRAALRGSKILKALKENRPALRVPAVILATEQYTVLEFLAGHSLGSWNKSSLTEAQRHVLLDHLANFLYSLWGADLHIQTDRGGLFHDLQ